MKLPDNQVRTAEVRNWKGVHLLHFQASSCSQKVRILLAEKRIPWTSHPINLTRFENTTPWFLGINPRGVVPVLVHDGSVHVESNDILAYLDETLPSSARPFFPQNEDERQLVAESLNLENNLHIDLRTITMGVLVPHALAVKPPKRLAAYEKHGAPDASRAKDIAWWRAFSANGVTAAQVRDSFGAFQSAFEGLDARLQNASWLIGDRISVLEIAWFISIRRLVLAGYPLGRHPHLLRHYERLRRRPSFARETRERGLSRLVLCGYRFYRILRSAATP